MKLYDRITRTPLQVSVSVLPMVKAEKMEHKHECYVSWNLLSVFKDYSCLFCVDPDRRFK